MSFLIHGRVLAQLFARLMINPAFVVAGSLAVLMADTSSAAADPDGLIVRTAEGFEGGNVYLPRGGGPHPCILVLHGSEGGLAGWSHVAAHMFAAHGFAAMPLNYSRGGNYWRAGDIVDVDLDDTESAMNWMRRSKTVECTKVGLYGISRGAEHALLLASLLAGDGSSTQPDAVAVHAPTSTIWGAFYADRIKPDGTYDTRSQPGRYRAWRWRGSYEGVEPGSRIMIERYAGPVFLSHGEDDKLWSVDNTRRLEERLRASGRTPEVHYYAGQGHGVDAETRNLYYENILAFFARHLSR